MDTTLVAVITEFGRTPIINKTAGRDHWSNVLSIVMPDGSLMIGFTQATGPVEGRPQPPKTRSPLLDADPPIHRDVGRAITDPNNVPALFDELAKWNVTSVKIYAGTARSVGRAIIEKGHRRGLLVTAHLGRYSAQDLRRSDTGSLSHAVEPGHRGNTGLPEGT